MKLLVELPTWMGDTIMATPAIENLFKFYKNYEQIMDESAGVPWTKWCVGGKTNIVLNCIDRHKDKELFNDTFIFSSIILFIWRGFFIFSLIIIKLYF